MTAISEQEKLRRRECVESVKGTHAMEGLFPDEPTLHLLDQYVAGELTMQELSSALDAHALQLISSSARMAGVA